MVVSNHRDLEPVARGAGIPFHHIPVTPETKADAEAAALELLGDVDLVVLARYMQIVSADFCSRFPERLINIHHSFLPAFVGANPYQAAHDRGVKLIGATAHYVTPELDAGPIIEQEVARVDHRATVEDMRRVGRYVERQVLAQAVTWHCEDRVIVEGPAHHRLRLSPRPLRGAGPLRRTYRSRVSTTSERSTGTVARTAGWVAPLCWIAVLLDGFDLVVVGTVVPTLQSPEEWALSGAGTTFVITIGLVGMMIGALTIGTLTDVIGRRKALIGAVTAFSIFTLACAFAPNEAVFGVLRFLAGLGLGGCLPTAIAMVNEFSRSGRSGRATTTIMTGYHVGAVATAALAIVVIPNLGWRWMFVIGALPALVLVPLMFKQLPESASWLVAHGRRAEAEEVAGRYGLELEDTDAPVAPHAGEGAGATIRTLFTGTYVRNTAAIAVTSFMGLLLVYGLNNWLPTIMREADYELGDALAFLLVLNVGAIVGLLDRRSRGRPDRRAGGGHRLVRRRRGLPGAAVDQAPDRRHLRHGLPDRLPRVQRPGARLRVRQRQPPAAGAGHRTGLVGRCRPGRCDRRPGDHRRPVHRGTRVPVGLLRLRRRRRAGRARVLRHRDTAVLRTAPRSGAVPPVS